MDGMQKMQEHFSARGEHTMESAQVDPGLRDQAARRATAAPAYPYARGIPYVLHIKSSGSKITWAVPLLNGVCSS